MLVSRNINQSDVIEEEADGSDDGSDDESKYHDTEDADENLNVVNVRFCPSAKPCHTSMCFLNPRRAYRLTSTSSSST